MKVPMNDTKTKTQTKPEITIRRWAVAASIWKRQAPSGFAYFDFSLSRAWKAKSSGRDGYSLNFFCDNEEQLGVVTKEVSSWIAERQADLQANSPSSDCGQEFIWLQLPLAFTSIPPFGQIRRAMDDRRD